MKGAIIDLVAIIYKVIKMHETTIVQEIAVEARCQFHQRLRAHFSYKIWTPKPEQNYKKLPKRCSYKKFVRKNVDEIDYRTA